MQRLLDVARIVVRAAQLAALAIAPPLVSPEPRAEPHPVLASALAAAVLAGLAFAAERLSRRVPGRDTRAAAVLIWVALGAAAVGATIFRGDAAPLGRGVLLVAVPLWAGLALAGGAVAQRTLGARSRYAGPATGALVAGVGLALFIGVSGWLFSTEGMWWAALAHDPEDDRALGELTRGAIGDRNYDAVRGILDRCLAAQPGACACLSMRAEVALRIHAVAEAVSAARAAVERCSTGEHFAPLSIALSLHGEPAAAEGMARAGMAKGENGGRLHYALALALDQEANRAAALGEAMRAVSLGGAGRDAILLAGGLWIAQGDLDQASKLLAPLVDADPLDAKAAFDLALVADKRSDYNRAREGYLAALHADPNMADARYNLALLTFRRGVLPEARHHAQRFRESFPADPRGLELLRMLEGAGAP